MKKVSKITERFTDNGTTVTDTKTGLTWLKEDDGKRRTLKEAVAYCKKLGKGWRLPAVEELFTLVDFKRHYPAIDPIFTNTQASYYWSSTPYAGGSDFAWIVLFYYGYVSYNGVDSYYFVRPVRQNSL